VIDIAISALLLWVVLVVILSYGARVILHGAPHFARVERNGTSPLLGQSAMEMAYLALAPLGNALVRWRVTANAVTTSSLVFGLGAGVALAVGHFGVAGALSALCAFADALDGYVARETGTASDAGETYDAAVDRYVEFFFFGGVLFHEGGSTLWVGLVLAALIGSFMVSYGTAKAEALRVEAPRGAMRRTERAAYLTFAAIATPFTAAVLPPAYAEAPMALALGLVGIVGNVSAAHRFFKIAELAARRDMDAVAKPPSNTAPQTERRDVHASAGRATT